MNGACLIKNCEELDRLAVGRKGKHSHVESNGACMWIEDNGFYIALLEDGGSLYGYSEYLDFKVIRKKINAKYKRERKTDEPRAAFL